MHGLKHRSRLQRIANVLLLNASFIDNLGLLNGKIGIAIFFYKYARYTDNKTYEDFAGDLIDEIYEEISTNTPVDFANGLTGIGWGIEYLIKNGFVEADADKALAEIDNSVYQNRLYRPFLLDNSNDLFGYGFYFITRLQGQRNDDNNLTTLFKKQHLIYLTDDCERILIQKQYLDFNIQSLSLETVNSFVWFLLYMNKLGIFPVKVEKLFHSLPEYIESASQSSDDIHGLSLLLRLTEYIIPTIADKGLQKILKTILIKKNGMVSNIECSDNVMIDNFIKNIWQQMVYEPYLTEVKQLQDTIGKIFLIIEDEENWNRRLDNLNKDNLGLTGFAGLGLGLLSGRMNKELRTTKVEVCTE